MKTRLEPSVSRSSASREKLPCFLFSAFDLGGSGRRAVGDPEAEAVAEIIGGERDEAAVFREVIGFEVVGALRPGLDFRRARRRPIVDPQPDLAVGIHVREQHGIVLGQKIVGRERMRALGAGDLHGA